MKIFLICPVRNAKYYPARDNPFETTDDIGFDICKENTYHIWNADEVHIFWDSKSQGSLFDLGAAFGLGKPLVIANPHEVEATINKSFSNMITEWSKHV